MHFSPEEDPSVDLQEQSENNKNNGKKMDKHDSCSIRIDERSVYPLTATLKQETISQFSNYLVNTNIFLQAIFYRGMCRCDDDDV